jgi:hypothetical protein
MHPEDRAPIEIPGASPRWRQMSGRVRLTLEQLGALPADVAEVLYGLEEAGAHRAPHFVDEEDPAWLHPGRVVLLARVDAEITDPAVLAVAAGLDQAFFPWTAPGARAALDAVGFPFLEGEGLPTRLPQGIFGGGVGDARPGDGASAPEVADAFDAWLTDAALLDPVWGAVLLADALDHLRHLHMHPDRGVRVRGGVFARDLLLPLAERFSGSPHGRTLHRRIRWWVRRVQPGLAAR